MKRYYNNDIVSEIEMNINNKNYSKALYLSEKYLEDYPEDRLGPIYRARALGAAGEVEEAIQLFNRAIDTKFHDRSSYIIAYTWYGHFLMDIGETDKAMQMLYKAISYESDGAKGLAIRARIAICNYYTNIGEYDKAFDIIDIKNVDQSLINSKKGYIYLIKGDYHQAIKHCKKVRFFKNPKSEQMNNYYLGKAYYLLRDFKNAVPYLKKCLSVKNKLYYQATSTLGSICYINNEYDQALSYANMLVNGDCGNIKEDGYRLLFRINSRLGNFKEAEDALNNINNFLDKQYYLVYLCYLTGQYEKALELSPFLLSHNTDERISEGLRTYIHCLMRLGKYDEAEYFMNCVKDDLAKPFVEIVTAHLNKERNIKEGYFNIYSANQVQSYDREKAIEHVVDHHLLNGYSKFNDVESVRQIFDELKVLIAGKEPIPDGLNDRYFVHYTGVGYDKKGTLNTLEVITNMNTDEIITVYPLSGTDIEEEEEVKPKELKRMSQIDKFNKRYGKQ